MPKNLRVENRYFYDAVNQTGTQRLVVFWDQNGTGDLEQAVNYYVYRWTTSTEALDFHYLPEQNKIAGPIPHTNGVDELSFVDDGTNDFVVLPHGGTPPTAPQDWNKTFWYTVRAEDAGCHLEPACAVNLSAHSGPAFGVLRERVGPDGPDGTIITRCTDPVVTFDRVADIPIGQFGIPGFGFALIPDMIRLVSAVDNCPGLRYAQYPPAGTSVPLDTTNIVTVVVTDASGNSTNCTVSPLIEQIAYRGGSNAFFGAEGAFIEDPFIAVVPVGTTDSATNCFAELPDLTARYDFPDCSEPQHEVIVSQTPPPGTLLPVGNHVIRIEAEDVYGNKNVLNTSFIVFPPTDPDPHTYEIFVLDTQPVVIGAAYRYLLVVFEDNGESMKSFLRTNWK